MTKSETANVERKVEVTKFLKVTQIGITGRRVDTVINADAVISAERFNEGTYVTTTAIELFGTDEQPTSAHLHLDMPIEQFFALITSQSDQP